MPPTVSTASATAARHPPPTTSSTGARTKLPPRNHPDAKEPGIIWRDACGESPAGPSGPFRQDAFMEENYKETVKTMYIILYNVAPGRNCVVNGPVRAGLWCVVVAGYVPGALAIYAIWQDLQHDIL